MKDRRVKLSIGLSRYGALILLTASLAGCSTLQSAVATAQARPFVPTLGAPTPFATLAAPTPVSSAFAPGNPTAIPTIVLTGAPPAFNIQPEAILIIDPPVNASVTSPVHVIGEADPTFEQTLVVQITDAEGKAIATVPTTIQAEVGQRGSFAVDVSFAVAAEGPGRISVYSTSARDGGMTHLSSVEVTLKP